MFSLIQYDPGLGLRITSINILTITKTLLVVVETDPEST